VSFSDQLLIQQFVADHTQMAKRLVDEGLESCPCRLCDEARGLPWWRKAAKPLPEFYPACDLASGKDGQAPADTIYNRAAHTKKGQGAFIK
jgi:hypothetical protein